jgi:predicted ATP-grasp superfamily ATP-dependent carboligase
VTATDLAAIIVAVTAVVAALTGLLVQTQKLISVAERYMTELKRQNELQREQVGIIAHAIVGTTPTTGAVDSPTDREP